MNNINDLTGKRFGSWFVLTESRQTKNSFTHWLCRCKCGIQKLVAGHSLYSGLSTSCGCTYSPSLVGRKFGYLTVQEKDTSRNKQDYWSCLCRCRKNISVSAHNLKNHVITSCGCVLDPLRDRYNIRGYTSMDTEDFPRPNPLYAPSNREYLMACQDQPSELLKRTMRTNFTPPMRYDKNKIGPQTPYG